MLMHTHAHKVSLFINGKTQVLVDMEMVKHLEFFQYSVKVGRIVLLQSMYKCSAAMKHWTTNNVNALQLTKFCKWLWSM